MLVIRLCRILMRLFDDLKTQLNMFLKANKLLLLISKISVQFIAQLLTYNLEDGDRIFPRISSSLNYLFENKTVKTIIIFI